MTTIRSILPYTLALAAALASAPALAADTKPAASGSSSSSLSLSTSTPGADSGKTADATAPKEGGAVLLGAKAGGIVPFGGLGANARAGIEVGYVFPWMKRSFAFAIDADYAAPKKSGSEVGDARLPGGAYDWHLTEQELMIMPVFMYRMTSLGSVVPYAGIGPRIYMLRSNVKGSVGASEISETTEQSTKVGFGVPLGAEIKLGPGALLAELLLEYGALDHTATGTSNTGAASLSIGYRLFL